MNKSHICSIYINHYSSCSLLPFWVDHIVSKCRRCMLTFRPSVIKSLSTFLFLLPFNTSFEQWGTLSMQQIISNFTLGFLVLLHCSMQGHFYDCILKNFKPQHKEYSAFVFAMMAWCVLGCGTAVCVFHSILCCCHQRP